MTFDCERRESPTRQPTKRRRKIRSTAGFNDLHQMPAVRGSVLLRKGRLAAKS